MHFHRRTQFATLVALAAVVAGCQCSAPPVKEGLKPEGVACGDDAECETGLCDALPGAVKLCMRKCIAGCHDNEVCSVLGVERFGCVPERAGLCQPCARDSDCPYLADRCLTLGAEQFCGRDCSYDGTCPDSFRCSESTTVDGTLVTGQCQPMSGTCECTSLNGGQEVPCQEVNSFGTCVGKRRCIPPAGYGPCSARVPAVEVCNGVDDDCNGKSDDELGETTCGLGICLRTVANCANGEAQTCRTGDAGPEVCDDLDNDCDGVPDNGFDKQSDVMNCGACNRACAFSNGDPYCDAGQCQLGPCEPGFWDLDGNPANGCEYACTASNGGVEVCDGLDNDCDGLVDEGFNLNTDPLNCASCGHACNVPGGTVATYGCSAKVCTIAACATGRADCDQVYATGCEVDTTGSLAHCGGCNQPCATPHAIPVCSSSQCAIQLCDLGWKDCDGQVADGCEVDSRSDVNHCGACGNVCGFANANASCASSTCGFTCKPGFWDLDGNPANGCEYACPVGSDSDPLNCGSCGFVCSVPGGTVATYACPAKSCAIATCATGRADCDLTYADGCEVDVRTDVSNCGSCGHVCNVAGGSVTAYSCVAQVCGIAACAPGRADCDLVYSTGCEVDTTSSVSNCGGCNQPCATPHATPTCFQSLCRVQSCDTGWKDCDGDVGNGCEVDSRSDVNHCGGCAIACSFANADAFCSNSACGFTCKPGFWDLDGNPANGCEYACAVASDSDPLNCGSCGHVCNVAGGTVASYACPAKACAIASCSPGRADCDLAYADGCEVNLRVDAANCGSCGHVCNVAGGAVAAYSCAAEVCGIASCTPGRADCDLVYSTGCEVDTTSSLPNCGGCNQACATPHATPTCFQSLCRVQACDPGWKDCDGDASNGCEVDSRVDVAHCGGCGVACSFANADAFCSSSACGFTCQPGFWDLDGNPGNGCEYACAVGSDSDPLNCGSCGLVCNVAGGTVASYACPAKTCAIASCVGGRADCDLAYANGCEVDTTSSLSHCGGCAQPCATPHATSVCDLGQCKVSACDPGWKDCNGLASDGCEIDSQSSLSHCGACGNACNLAHAVPSCQSGQCVVSSCLPGYWNLDGVAANGCEYACVPTNLGVEACDGVDDDCDGLVDEGFSLSSDPLNCGSCAHVCNVPGGAVASYACNASNCAIASCVGGRADCDVVYGNGCEVDTTSSLSHCGGCNQPCSTSHATPVCDQSQCKVQACSPGWKDCDGQASNGCEVDSTSDVNHCGFCGNACSFANANAFCSGSTCGFTCKPGFWDLDGNPANGCEYACNWVSSVDLPDLGFADANCDGIDGELGNAVFVAPPAAGGSDAYPGTRALPKATIAAGIAAAVVGGQRDVLVAVGSYVGTVAAAANKGVYGGYQAGTWSRSAANSVTVSGANPPLVIDNASGATVQLMSFLGTSAAGSEMSAYGAVVRNSASVLLQGLMVKAGDGAPGQSGGDGAGGASASNGGTGAPGCEDSSGLFCTHCGRPSGGAGGWSACGMNGGAGGWPGRDGTPGDPGGTGAGGTPGGLGRPCCQGNTTAPPWYDGAAGANGAGGDPGVFGAGFGNLDYGGYLPAFTSDGLDGAHGNGGGGAGAGGGGTDNCNSYGSAGGGGGGGGCAGQGGRLGTSGGASIGIFLYASSVTGDGLAIYTGTGGAGGNAGSGGGGGMPGGGGGTAYGGGSEQDDGSNGGVGGSGGWGGTGGAGGAGGGGPTVGVAIGASSSWSPTGGTMAILGTPGAPGSSPGGSGQWGIAQVTYP